MNWIWSFEKLSKICRYKKPDPDVLAWAINRIGWLYPEKAGEIVIQFINSNNKEAAEEAAEFFLRNPGYGKPYLEDLENAYEKNTGKIAGLISSILVEEGDSSFIDLFQRKYSENYKHDPVGFRFSLLRVAWLKTGKAREVIQGYLTKLAEDNENWLEVSDTIFKSYLTAYADEPIILRFLDFIGQHPQLHMLYDAAFVAIGDFCDEWYEKDFLKMVKDEETGKDEVPAMLEDNIYYIHQHGHGLGKKPEQSVKMFEKGKYDEIVQKIYQQTIGLLEEKKSQHGEENYSLWEKGRGRPRHNIEAIDAIYKVIGNLPGEYKMAAAASAVFLFSGLAELEMSVGRPIRQMDIKTALEFFLHQRSDIDEEEEIINILNASNEREKIIESCFKSLLENPDSPANGRVVEFLAKTGDKDVIKKLLPLNTDEYLWHKIIGAVREVWSKAPEFFLSIIEEAEIEGEEWVRDFAMETLGEMPVEGVVQMILNNWEELWVRDKYLLLEKVRKIGDRRFIKPLKNELKEGEFLEGETFSFLCRLNGVKDPVLKKIEKDTIQSVKPFKRKLEQVREQDYLSLLKEPLIFELTCRRCRRTYHYTINKIMLFNETEEIFIKDPVTCKHCGALDHYEGDPGIHQKLLPLILSLSQLKPEDIDPEERDEFVIMLIDPLLIEGKIMTLEEA
nr:hypothetical protein [Candidatus Aminicenantes bacterium]NIM84745.1 hypothetical protein [Candidatus Aminicenantes bacterium]NIN24238.1 hypothetical protein [Candidatus Aminicenantes bacterium]NIN47965.1 hypothetical protein [Candidatus Aminicenantes bacterium]NIN90901.1 hypothetical protein [Candidatus Aminicenantes bacterium]